MLAEIKRVFKDTVVYGLGSLIPKAAGIILVPIYTRFLAPADYGIMSLASITTTIVGSVLVLGQTGSLTLYLRSVQSDVSEEDRRRLLFSVTVFTLVFAAAVIAALFPFGPTLTRIVFDNPEFTFDPFVGLALVTALLGLPLMLFQAVNRAQGRARSYASLQLASFAVNTGFTLWFVVAMRQGALGSIKGTLVAAATLAPVALWSLGRRMTFRFSGTWLKKSLLFGLPLIPHAFAGWALTFADRALLARYSGLDETGLYALAYSISMVMNLASQSINQAWGPIYYDLADSEEGRAKLPRLTTVYAVAVVFLGMVYMLFSREVLLVLAAERYWEASRLVPIIVGGYVCFALYSVLSTGIFFAKRTGWVAAISATSAVLNVGLNLWLIPRFGMWAAAWNTLLAYACMAVAARVLSERLAPGRFEDGRLLALVGVFAAVFVANLSLQATDVGLAVALSAKVVLLVAAAGALVGLRVITSDEIRTLVRRLRRGKAGVTP